MNTDKYKQLVEQRIISTFDEWTTRATVEEREIYRFLHNIKGTAGTIGMLEIEKVAEQKINIYSDQGNRHFTYLEWYEQLKSLLEAISADKGQGQLSEGVITSQNPLWEMHENRILIIDDDVELAGYLKEILEEHSYPVNLALTAERGLKLFYD
ncbi:response regulator transcription factor [Paenibacillus crassostreae]|uniref:Response regulatory domain-containing protein n=1 Tax=Paenibacillus crassostreae TaxID=1763538 RepID=A0A167GBB6_9BACL|nr:response regulator transcription factor [Paenibacillus crassostreae]OAB77410.1 hypothetical protein PNBC_01685 [Paenibacillus crassostreae]